MGWIVSLVVWAGTVVIGRLLRPRPKIDKPMVGSFDADQIPTASELAVIPVVWGTVLLPSVNVLWYGNTATAEIKEGNVVVGYKYFMTVQYGLCMGPIDRVIGVDWDGLWPNIFARIDGSYMDRIFYRHNTLFGGDKEGGGIYTEIRSYNGWSTQLPDSDLEGKTGLSLPGYQRLAYLVMRNNPYPTSEDDPCMYILLGLVDTCPCDEMTLSNCHGSRSAYVGTSAMLHPMSVEVRRVDVCNPLGLTSGAHDIDGDANPANMIYEIIHDDVWGLGIPDAQGIDKDSFIRAGETLATEGFGLSMFIDSAQEAKSAIEEILRHIDGVLALSPDTGLVELRLIRGDYVADDLPLFGPNEIRSFSFSRPSLDTLSNTVRVAYLNRTDRYAACVVTVQDIAGIQSQGRAIVQDVSYTGVSNAALAQRLAARDLKVVSYPWARISFSVDRSAWNLRQGSPFRLSWQDLGILNMACRVSRISPGDLVKGEIAIDAIEDVFGVSWTAYGAIAPTDWDDPFQP